MRFVDINNIKGSKLDIDASDLKSFEKSRVISDSKKKSKIKLGYNNMKTSFINSNNNIKK